MIQDHKKKFIIVMLFLIASMIPSTLFGQELLVQQGEATVEILNENIDDAQKRAIVDAKINTISLILSQFISPQTILFKQKELNQAILSNPDRFLESTRIVETTESEDLNELNLVIEARVFSVRLTNALKQMNLVLLSDPLKKVTLLYDPREKLWESSNGQKVFLTLNQFLAPYRIQIHKFIPLSEEWFAAQESEESLTIPEKILSLSNSKAFLLLDFSPNVFPEGGSTETDPVHLSLSLYETRGGSKITSLEVQHQFSEVLPEENFLSALEQLAAQWEPLILQLIDLDRQYQETIMLHLSGLSMPQQEQQFIREVFQNHPQWSSIQLHGYTANSAIYRGQFNGVLTDFIEKLRKTPQRFFEVKQVYLTGNQLNLGIEWIRRGAELDLYRPIEAIDAIIESNVLPPPEYQVPSMRTKSNVDLPADVVVYDYLRSRGDSTLFEMRRTNGQQSMLLEWFQVDRSNLQIVVSVYDEHMQLLGRHEPDSRGAVRSRLTLPPNQQTVFIRVSDRNGFIEGESGSFLSIHYLIRMGQ